MKRYVTFSRSFPAKHPRAGEPTHFMEKILNGLPDEVLHPWVRLKAGAPFFSMTDAHDCREEEPDKHHTIRAGKSWKVGDILIPCIWELDGGRFTKGNKKIQFAPELEITAVWDFDIDFIKSSDGKALVMNILINGKPPSRTKTVELISNDGLVLPDFAAWFHKCAKLPFSGQILCWNKEVGY